MKRRLCCAAIAWALFAAVAVRAEPEPAAEAPVKAAVIYNLLLFIDWPADGPGGDFRLCLFEGGALASALEGFVDKSVHGRRLALQLVGNAPEKLWTCGAAVVEGGNPAALARAAAAAKTQPLLVIGEGASALDRGAMIGLATVGSRIAFDIDLAALRRARLTASSKLLRLARQVLE
ncbi:MAG: YfiR family protein [Rhodocyclaceae bacterium]|nr:YfiR family protein [Rhodocyclaceae bacterium]